MDLTTEAMNYSYYLYYSYSDSPYDHKVNMNESIFYKIGIILIFIVGITANTCVLVLITLVRELRNASNVFIFILCASNNIFLIVFTPTEIFKPDFLGKSLLMNKLLQFTLILFCSVSILSLLMMSYERWRAVVRPMDIKSHNVRSTVIKVTVVLILAVILALPTGFVHYVKEDEETNTTVILMDQDILQIVTYYCMITLYLCPLGLISFLYLSMAKKLLTQGKTIRESLRHHVKPRAQRSRVAWVVVGLVVSFAVCWFPFYLFLIIYVTDPEYYNRPIYNFLLNWRPLITTLNTCIDPLSIFVLGSRFRNQLRRYILCQARSFSKDRSSKRGTVTTTVRRTRSSSGSTTPTRAALQLPQISPKDVKC